MNIEQYKEIQSKIENLAARWVKGMGSYAVYGSASGVKFSPDFKFIYFTAMPTTSGMGWGMSISSKYLNDDSELEKDAAEFYQNYTNENTKKHNRIQELEKTPEVIEYLKLTNKLSSFLNLTYPFL